jgi:DNA repair exonuclease SbcCD nuclease subunit
MIGDVHIGLHNNELDKWLEIHKQYFYDFFIPTVKKTYQQGDKIAILGDLFDNRTFLNLKVINFALDLFDRFEQEGFEIHIIGGNHDYYNDYDAENSSLSMLRRYSNVTLYLKPRIVNWNDTNILMMPWDSIPNQLSIIKKAVGKSELIFCHSELRGVRTGVKNVLAHGLSVADFVMFPRIYASHIHIRQTLNNITYLGSPFQMDRNDKGDQKCLLILDLEKNTEEYIPNMLSPQYRTIEILEDKDISKLDSLILEDTNDFIDIVIDNDIIVKNHVLKHRLEELQTVKHISKMDYVDKNVIVEDIKDIELDDIGVTVSTEQLLRDYIEAQNDDDKSKMIEIYDDTLKKLSYEK